MRPNHEGDWNLAYLSPDDVVAAKKRNRLVLLPLAPAEWHGSHLAMGCDGLLAHAFAGRLARELECPYYPPLYLGTERERRPETLRSLGFQETDYVVGMDFPAHSIQSGYVREEVFSLAVRGVLDTLFDRTLEILYGITSSERAFSDLVGRWAVDRWFTFPAMRRRCGLSVSGMVE